MAGGGGGGETIGGGGGAGGLIYSNVFNVTSGVYTVTIGSGGQDSIVPSTLRAVPAIES